MVYRSTTFGFSDYEVSPLQMLIPLQQDAGYFLCLFSFSVNMYPRRPDGLLESENPMRIY